MKILHVIPSLGPSLGGPAQVAMNLVKALRELGTEAEIATTNHDSSHPLSVPLHQRVDYSFGADAQRSVPVWFFPYDRPALKEFIFSRALTCWCWKHLRNYDVIDNHYLFSYAPTCAATIARWHHIPYTVRTMGQLTPWALAQSHLKKQIYTGLIERHNLKGAAAIHCTTPSEADDVRNFGVTTPTITLPLGVNPLTFDVSAKEYVRKQYQIASNTPIILFLSRLHYKKRPDLLLQSLSQLHRQGYNFHLILAGSGDLDYIAALERLATSLELTDRVSFAGLVVGAAKEQLLQGADVFVLPSFSENFGIAVAEALSAGLPVVITPGVQIAPEIAAANAGLVIPGEVEPLANAIAQLLSNPGQRQKLGNNGQQLAAERYSWQTIAQKLIPLYQRIAERQPLPEDIRFEYPLGRNPISRVNP